MPTVSFSELLGDLRQIGITVPSPQVRPTEMVAIIESEEAPEETPDTTHSRR